ncbi:MAG TPA: ABC transporter permease [Lacunisphaera sp.]|nr:ABC transporter permease [Lacunisphaera sp.]
MPAPFRLLRNLLGRGRRLRRLEEEMSAHVEMLYEEHLRAGLAPAEARRQANLAFGNLLVAREESVDVVTGSRLESWGRDIAIAARGLARRPAFTGSLVAILALGLGATTAIFSLIRGVLWDALPVPAPQELQLAVQPDGRPFRLSAPTVQRLEADPVTRGRVIAFSSAEKLAARLDAGPAQPLEARFVHGGFFEALQLRPAAGRWLSAADDEVGRPRPVAVVAHRWWRDHLGGDPAAVGRVIRLNGVAVTIVGVAPEGFTGVALGESENLWLPAGLHATLNVWTSASISSRDEDPKLADWIRDDHVAWFSLMLRMPAGSAAVQRRLEAAWWPQREAFMSTVDEPAQRERVARNVPRLVPSPRGYSETRHNFRRVGLTLSLLVGAVVLVTVANSSTMLLLRVLARRRELGVRVALGAGRWRLVRGALLEGMLLAAGGAACGALLGCWLTPVLSGWLVPAAAGELRGPDWSLFVSLGALALVLGPALAAAPAWLSARVDPQAVLQQRFGAGPGGMRLGRLLIVIQLALSVLLLAFAGSLALDLRRVLQSDLGYGRQAVVTAAFDPASAGLRATQMPAVMARMRQAAMSFPQVRHTGFALFGALSGSRWNSGIYVRGPSAHPPGNAVQHDAVDGDFFDAMGMTLVAGRRFSDTDTAQSPRVVIVNQAMARAVFGSASPLHRRFGFDTHEGPEDMEIVGVVADARVNGVREAPLPMFYASLGQGDYLPGCIAVRLDGDAALLLPALQKAIGAVEPNLMFPQWLTMEQRVRHWVRNDQAAVRLTAGFALLATLLAGLGVLGALGYLVATRARDLAVRLALGAEPGQVRFGIVRDALQLGATGSALGLLLAMLLPRVLDSWMMTGLRTDWRALAGAALFGLAAALLGGLLPAWRAAKVDPLTLLRAE